ncbi:MAG: hypothetical protein M1818_005835 [Claussenomyces sp. TS43310]|nr:MAG: hypothetical protein M1818_005835 [Claussenomyces sp. TS43310]
MAFFSTYDLYKQGTAHVVQWLAATAAACGFTRDEETNVQEKKKKKKGSSNGKGRGKAKSKQASGAPLAGKQVVSISDLPELASFIAQKTSNLETLPGVVKVLKDVILQRRQWSQVFTSQDQATLNSNQRHAHFVGVLEKVYHLLQAAIGVPKDKSSILDQDEKEEKPSNETMARDLSNLFAVLEVEECADIDQDPAPNTSTQAAAPPQRPPVTYELEDDADEEEIWIQIYAFFNDFIDVRNHVRKSWQDYASGLLDLPSVAVTTNVALEILQRAEVELKAAVSKNHQELNKYENIAMLVMLAEAHSLGVDPDVRHQEGDIINMELVKSANLTCMSTYVLLSSFLPVLQAGSVPYMKPGFLGQLDLSGRPKSWRQQFDQDKIALLEFLPDICLLRYRGAELPVTDELSRGLLEMMSTKHIPIWLVLGCRLWLDIGQMMIDYNAAAAAAIGAQLGVTMGAKGSATGIALGQLRVTGAHVYKTLRDYLRFSEGMSLETWPQQNDQVFRNIISETQEWIIQDFFATMQTKYMKTHASFQQMVVRPYSFLSRHPLLCGLMQFHLNMRMQEAGTTLANAWGSLPAVMHLYNAVKQESPGNDFPLWEDLEAVIRIQGKERIFIGDYPKNAKEYLNRFCLLMGVSATNFAINRQETTPGQAKLKAAKRGPRQATDISDVNRAFRDQYLFQPGRSDVTFHRVEKLLGPIKDSKGKNSQASTKKSVTQPLTPVPFLSSLQDCVQADILALNINYVSLHMCCFDLLRDVHVKLDAYFKKYIGGEYLEKENQLPFLVGYIFSIAVGSSRTAEALKISEPSTSSTLLSAGDVVKGYVEKEGSRELNRVRNACRGYDWLE